MQSNYIQALAQRHASLDRKINEAMRAPHPDTLEITRLKKLRLACRDRMQEAIRVKRKRITHRQVIYAEPAVSPSLSGSPQTSEGR